VRAPRPLLALLLAVLLLGGAAGCGPDRISCQFPIDGKTCSDGTACLNTVDGCQCGCTAMQRCAYQTAGAGDNLHAICVSPCNHDNDCLIGQTCSSSAAPCVGCDAIFSVCQ
jgi:hypothetical protein